MQTKEEILKSIRTIINDNKMSIYNIANIAGINRSTLQKSLSGDRYLNLRQFNSLINVLPISNAEKDSFYKKYIDMLWGREQIIRTETILDVLSTIENSIDKKNDLYFKQPSLSHIDLSKITGKQNVIETVKNITVTSISSDKNTDIYAYIPFNSNFFVSSAGDILNNCWKKVSVSILYEFLKPGNINSSENPTILKNILPLLLNNDNIYNFHYVYVDSYFYDNHLALYPYYIIYPDIALLLSSELNTLIAITDKNVLKNMRDIHNQNTKKANRLNVMKIKLDDCITHLMTNKVSSNMYAISYEPCITSFVPPSMYADLISDDFPNKAEFLSLIENRIHEINVTSKKYALFNAASITDFVDNGNLLIFNHPYLKKCSIPQRIEVLTNIINTMDDSAVIMRAYNNKKLGSSKKFEITNIQNLYNFDILVYQDNGYVKLIDIHEPIISSYFIDFIHNIIETPLVFTYEETRQLIMDSITKLKMQI